MPRALALLAVLAPPAAGAALGCAHSDLPEPEAAVARYAEAAKRGDGDALYGMLTRSAQRSYGRPATRALVREARAELGRKSQALSQPNTQVTARARVRFADGEGAEFELEDGGFRIASAGALPSGARTPAQALGELRQALARRSYASLLRVLSQDKRTALEGDLRSLVSGLEQPETLDIKVSGDTAEVRVPGGHSVKLKREAGVWRIDDFD
ncbi:MAG TPA: hypothetical protein VK524_05910 [Polyangiaceae bacterium]|nr:hypothetical protein [Polyangiaceae bacterium]